MHLTSVPALIVGMLCNAVILALSIARARPIGLVASAIAIVAIGWALIAGYRERRG